MQNFCGIFFLETMKTTFGNVTINGLKSENEFSDRSNQTNCRKPFSFVIFIAEDHKSDIGKKTNI